MSFVTTTELMRHQGEATAKLVPSRVGALFMEMGTGKSRTVIELVKIRQHKIDSLVWFCPVSLKFPVRDEIVKHTDEDPDAICVFDADTSERKLPSARWYVCGIESMSASDRVVLAVNRLITERTFVVVDEGSYIKGHRSMRTVRITSYAERARYRLLLNGTPLTQGVVDLYAQMRFLSPQILGFRSFYSFAARHLEYSRRYPDMIVGTHNVELLAAKIAPYVYQVTKDECLDLPEKVYKTRYFSMTAAQRILYDRAKSELLLDIPDEYLDSMYAIYRLYTALQQITCGFWTRREGKHKERIEVAHHRLELLTETVAATPGDQKIIIWAKYHYDIAGIVRTLDKEFSGQGVAQFHGKLNEREREAELKAFRADRRFLVSHPGSGGHGLTVNEATYVIFYNNTFKFGERNQAEDRNHRIGQTRSVVYTDIICERSIDERIMRAIIKKEDVADSFRREIEGVKRQGLRERLMQIL